MSFSRIYNNQLWDISIVFNNHKDDPYELPISLLLEMVIEEDLLDWPHKGYLVYQNTGEMIEKDETGYTFRMDLRDEITIRAVPRDLPEDWELNFDFVVYDTEDPSSSSYLTKVKKIYFWDKRYQQLIDNKIQWSTATTDHNSQTFTTNSPSQLSDEERSMLTGDAIKALLTDFGFEDIIDDEKWDLGATKILYTSPTDSTVNDDLKYLLRRHVSEIEDKTDMCIFTVDKNSGKFQLNPLHYYYDNAEDLQLEHLYLEDFEGKKITTPSMAPDKGITIGQNSIIYSYNFVDTSGLDNTKALISKPIYWYDQGKGQFGTDFEDNEISEVKDNFKEIYVKDLVGDNPIFTLNKTKTEQHNIHPKFIFSDGTSNYFGTKTQRYPLGRNETLFSGIFLNECLTTRLVGVPIRKVGTFMGIDRYKGTPTNNKLDYKLLGQWFVVKVKHIWKHDMYVDDVVCVKINSYESLKIDEDVV